ncbi:MAG: hypothetical protein ACNI25_05180 [Halarcobacter sp.]
MKKIVLLSVLLSLLLTGCIGGGDSKKEWSALIYPDKNNTKRSKKIGVYPKLEQCQEASKAELVKLGLETSGTYKCGLNCKYHEGMKVDICESLTD